MFLFRGQYLFPLFIAIPLFLILGCSESNREDNFAPRISVFEADSDIIEPGTSVDIQFKAVDIDGDKLSVECMRPAVRLRAMISVQFGLLPQRTKIPD